MRVPWINLVWGVNDCWYVWMIVQENVFKHHFVQEHYWWPLWRWMVKGWDLVELFQKKKKHLSIANGCVSKPRLLLMYASRVMRLSCKIYLVKQSGGVGVCGRSLHHTWCKARFVIYIYISIIVSKALLKSRAAVYKLLPLWVCLWVCKLITIIINYLLNIFDYYLFIYY